MPTAIAPDCCPQCGASLPAAGGERITCTTDDPNFDPNVGSNLAWEAMKRK